MWVSQCRREGICFVKRSDAPFGPASAKTTLASGHTKNLASYGPVRQELWALNALSGTQQCSRAHILVEISAGIYKIVVITIMVSIHDMIKFL